MIQFFRDKISNLVVKGLLVLIAIAFVITGAESRMQRNVKQEAVAEVGTETISAQEFGNSLKRVEQMIGDKGALRQFLPQIAKNSLQTLINEKLYTAFAREQNLTLAKSTLQQQISDTPAFQNEKGQFERTRYMLTLQNLGMTEEQLLQQLKSGLSVQYFNALFQTTPIVPTVLQEALQAYAGEERKIAYTVVPFAQPIKKDFSESALKDYYDSHKSRFLTEEQRAIKYILIDPAALAKDIAVTDADAEKYYNDNKAAFAIPEKRTVEQLLFDDAAEAKKAEALAARGVSFEEIAKQLPTAKQTNLGEVGNTDLLSELTDVAFKLAEGGVSGVVESPLGLHILKATHIKAGNTKTFAEAKTSILETLKKTRAMEKVYALGSDVEDKTYNGQSLETVATAKNLAVQSLTGIVFSANNAVPLLRENPALLEEIFKLKLQKTSGLLDLKSNAVALVQLDSIAPASPKPFAAVKADIEKALEEEEANSKTRERVRTLSKDITDGKPFATAVNAAGLKLEETPFLQRGKKLTGIPEGLLTQAFNFSPKKVITQPTNTGIMVATVIETKIVPITEDASVNALKGSLQQALGNDNKQQFEASLRSQFPVKINEAVYNSFFKKPEAE